LYLKAIAQKYNAPPSLYPLFISGNGMGSFWKNNYFYLSFHLVLPETAFCFTWFTWFTCYFTLIPSWI